MTTATTETTPKRANRNANVTPKDLSEAVLAVWLRTGNPVTLPEIAAHLNASENRVRTTLLATIPERDRERYGDSLSDVRIPGCDTNEAVKGPYGKPYSWEPRVSFLREKLRGEGPHRWRVEGRAIPTKGFTDYPVSYLLVAETAEDAQAQAKALAENAYGPLHGNSHFRNVEWLGKKTF